ncbi:nucleoside triphosphate pyrophosphohydrolase family protein [Chloroflexus sp.]|uniref:nucleoside triphosphate pyrophosphohydrolase family protein n=1 Tax=Chloroflexus sp. TaxID=1904827 RepID=UPI002ADD4DBC|nr:nucleoside triphosphate pyrophosphohydrolase family protein [Chloroflexus sp.]
MNADHYQELAMRTLAAGPTPRERLTNAALGLSGEAGEFADTVKKHLFHGHPLNREELLKELGDILWYAALACAALDVRLSTVMAANIEKLQRRYPEGFSSERSQQRSE